MFHLNSKKLKNNFFNGKQAVLLSILVLSLVLVGCSTWLQQRNQTTTTEPGSQVVTTDTAPVEGGVVISADNTSASQAVPANNQEGLVEMVFTFSGAESPLALAVDELLFFDLNTNASYKVDVLKVSKEIAPIYRVALPQGNYRLVVAKDRYYTQEVDFLTSELEIHDHFGVPSLFVKLSRPTSKEDPSSRTGREQWWMSMEYAQNLIDNNQASVFGYVYDESTRQPVAGAEIFMMSNESINAFSAEDGWVHLIFTLDDVSIEEQMMSYGVVGSAMRGFRYDDEEHLGYDTYAYPGASSSGSTPIDAPNKRSLKSFPLLDVQIDKDRQQSQLNTDPDSDVQSLFSLGGNCFPELISVGFAAPSATPCAGGCKTINFSVANPDNVSGAFSASAAVSRRHCRTTYCNYGYAVNSYPLCDNSQVINIAFWEYVKHVLPAEWPGNWRFTADAEESFKAAVVAIATTAVFFKNEAYQTGYDIAASECNQSFAATIPQLSDWVEDMKGWILTEVSGSITKAEYSAETNDPNGSCGDGYFKKTHVSSSNCYPQNGEIDYVSLGKPRDGHNRAMSQRGSMRWATGFEVTTSNSVTSNPILPATYQGDTYVTKDWKDILAHYYPYLVLSNCNTGEEYGLSSGYAQVLCQDLHEPNPTTSQALQNFQTYMGQTIIGTPGDYPQGLKDLHNNQANGVDGVHTVAGCFSSASDAEYFMIPVANTVNSTINLTVSGNAEIELFNSAGSISAKGQSLSYCLANCVELYVAVTKLSGANDDAWLLTIDYDDNNASACNSSSSAKTGSPVIGQTTNFITSSVLAANGSSISPCDPPPSSCSDPNDPENTNNHIRDLSAYTNTVHSWTEDAVITDVLDDDYFYLLTNNMDGVLTVTTTASPDIRQQEHYDHVSAGWTNQYNEPTGYTRTFTLDANHKGVHWKIYHKDKWGSVNASVCQTVSMTFTWTPTGVVNNGCTDANDQGTGWGNGPLIDLTGATGVQTYTESFVITTKGDFDHVKLLTSGEAGTLSISSTAGTNIKIGTRQEDNNWTWVNAWDGDAGNSKTIGMNSGFQAVHFGVWHQDYWANQSSTDQVCETVTVTFTWTPAVVTSTGLDLALANLVLVNGSTVAQNSTFDVTVDAQNLGSTSQGAIVGWYIEAAGVTSSAAVSFSSVTLAPGATNPTSTQLSVAGLTAGNYQVRAVITHTGSAPDNNLANNVVTVLFTVSAFTGGCPDPNDQGSGWSSWCTVDWSNVGVLQNQTVNFIVTSEQDFDHVYFMTGNVPGTFSVNWDVPQVLQGGDRLQSSGVSGWGMLWDGDGVTVNTYNLTANDEGVHIVLRHDNNWNNPTNTPMCQTATAVVTWVPSVVVAPPLDLALANLSVSTTSSSVSATVNAQNNSTYTVGTAAVAFYVVPVGTVPNVNVQFPLQVKLLSLLSGASTLVSMDPVTTASLSLSPGTYDIYAVITATGNYSTDVNLLNNVAASPFTVLAPGIDISVESVDINGSSTVTEGSYFTVTATVKNLSNTIATGVGGHFTWKESGSNNSNLIGNLYTIPNLAPGQSYTVSINVNTNGIAPGVYDVGFAAVLTGGSDINNSNNYADDEVTVQAQPKADLVMVIPSSTVYLPPGGSISSPLLGAVKNSGNASSSPCEVKWYLSNNATYGSGDVHVYTSQVGSLGPNQDQVVSLFQLNLSSNFTPGTYYIVGVVDPSDQVAESDEGNNQDSRKLKVELPDLDVDMTSSTFDVPILSYSPQIAADIENNSNVTAPASVLNWYWSSNSTVGSGDVFMGSVNIPSLSAGQSHTVYTNVYIAYGTSLGLGYVIGYVDYPDSIEEEDEGNNDDYRKINVVPFGSSANGGSSGSSGYGSSVASSGNITDSLTAGQTLSVYPNPANTQVTLQLHGGEPVNHSDFTVEVYDMTGRLVLSQPQVEFINSTYTLDLTQANLPNAMVLIKVTDTQQGRVAYERLRIEK